MSNDWPFSVTSKVVIPDTGAEHLVTIRAATAADMKSRLQEASGIFPYAALITVLEQGTAQAQPVVSSAAAAQTVQPLKSNSNGNGNGQRSPAAAAVAGQTQRANQRSAQARVNQKAALPQLCPEHQRSLRSRWGGYYCPTQLDDGTYCKWQWAPADASQVATAADVHPRDEN